MSRESLSTEKRLSLSRRLRLPLFTHGEHPEIDALKLCYELLADLPENVRMANLNFICDKFGYRLYDKLRGRFT